MRTNNAKRSKAGCEAHFNFFTTPKVRIVLRIPATNLTRPSKLLLQPVSIAAEMAPQKKSVPVFHRLS